MRIQIVPQGFLKASLGQEFITLDVEAGATVEQILGEIGVRRDLVLTAFVNDCAATIHSVLHEGDRIKIIPYTGGG